MGWWPLRIGDGGIKWGGSSNGLVNVQPGSSPQPESELVWGDGPADVVDGWIEDHIQELWDRCNDEFIRDMGREMTSLEFINGLAFSFRVCDEDLGGDIPSCTTHELRVQVVEITEHGIYTLLVCQSKN